MGSEIPSLGLSLLVPSVQELAKEALMAVPPRYVRPNQDRPPVLYDENANRSLLQSVPVIDMQRLFSQEFMELELQKLDSACKEWGFFQLINHGVSSALIENVKVDIQEFFNLPFEAKKKYWQKPGDVEGFGQAFVISEEQKLDWGDMFYMLTLPKNLRKTHLFPNLPLPLKDNLEAYLAEMETLALKLLNLMAKALGVEPSYMKELFEGGFQSMRMNYYPPCPQPELVMGLNSHSDAIALTILLQINEVEGLQIKKDGNWVPIKPLPNAFIINIGDMLEIVSNGIYPSIEHRATVNSVKERMSVATFYSPKLDGELGPAPSLITPQNPPLFKRAAVADFFKGFLSRELVGRSYLDVMRIHNSQGKNI